MLYVLIGMGICISLFIIAFAFARAAAHADEHHDSFIDQNMATGNDAASLSSFPNGATPFAPHTSIEVADERARRKHTDIVF